MDNVAFAGAFLLVAATMVYFLYHKETGHRTLVKLTAVFFFLGFVRYTWSSIALYNHWYELSTWLLTLSMLVAWLCAGYLFSNRRTVLHTLTVSEGQDRNFKESIADLRTITSGLVVRAETTEQKAVAVGRRYMKQERQRAV